VNQWNEQHEASTRRRVLRRHSSDRLGPHGLVDKSAVNKIITVIGELETTSKEPFNRFSDTVRADAVDLNFEYIIHVSLYRRSFYGKRPPIRSAILATDETLIHYAKVHALLTQVLQSTSAYSRIAKKPRNG